MKEIIAMLLFLLSMLAFVLLIIGFFNPRTALFWYGKPRTKGASALINGLVFMVAFGCCGLLLPPVNDVPPTEAVPQQAGDKKTDAPPRPEAPLSFEVVKVENVAGDIYCKLIIKDIYSRDALVEKTRQLKEQYQAKQKFSCFFYYRKYTEKVSSIAGTLYLEDCSHCQYKDKEGNPVDCPFYSLQPTLADSLRALHFDTAGYKQEAMYLFPAGKTLNGIYSSGGAKALWVVLDVTGHITFPLVKKVVHGQDRFYDPDDMENYYVINRADGMVDFYKNEQLDMQNVIEQ